MSAETPQQPETYQEPTTILILTDNFGYGNTGALYQNQRAEEREPHHKTPNLDTMAGEGMRLTRHYVEAPLCAPSRVSLLHVKGGFFDQFKNVTNII